MAAARIRLVVDAVDLVSLAQSIEQPCPFHVRRGVCGEKAVAALEYFGRPRNAAFGKLRADHAVARRLAWVDALDLRALIQIFADAGRETAGQPQRMQRLRAIEM